MARSVKVPDTVVAQGSQIAEERDMSLKEAIRYMCRSSEGYDV